MSTLWSYVPAQEASWGCDVPELTQQFPLKVQDGQALRPAVDCSIPGKILLGLMVQEAGAQGTFSVQNFNNGS